MRINKNSLIPYISIFISVLFYYAEMAHQLFFNIFSHATNAIALFDHINIISHYYLVYLIVITPVFVFLNGKMNSLYLNLVEENLDDTINYSESDPWANSRYKK